MSIEEKVLDPVCIRLGKNSNIVLPDEVNKTADPLQPGVLFGGEHYGFILIIDHNGRQREIIYPTQGTIQAIEMRDSMLKIYEDGKKGPWQFNQAGRLEHTTRDEFTEDFLRKCKAVLDDSKCFEDPILMNPVYIQIALDPTKSTIMKDESVCYDYPLYPGAMLGSVHYGFILVIETEEGLKEVAYPTQNRIDAIGIDGSFYDDLKVFEVGKYHPWLFTYNGVLKEKGSYNPYSRRDKEFIKECYALGEVDPGSCFTKRDKK